jgi:hypothetical protein
LGPTSSGRGLLGGNGALAGAVLFCPAPGGALVREYTGNAKSKRPRGVQPTWPNLELAAGLKTSSSRSSLLSDGFYIANKGPGPSKAPAGHHVAPGDNLLILCLMPRCPRGPCLTERRGCWRCRAHSPLSYSRSYLATTWGPSRGTPYPVLCPQTSCFALRRRQQNRWDGQSK